MVVKVYWKGLELTLNATRRYIERNQQNLALNLTAAQMACVTAVLNTIVTCLQALPPNTPTPP
jgi:hypothetical protein